VGSSRPKKMYSIMATTSGMLARKQMMVSTGTYCTSAATRASGHGYMIRQVRLLPCCDIQWWHAWAAEGARFPDRHVQTALQLQGQTDALKARFSMLTCSALTLQYKKPAKQHTTATYFLPFSHLRTRSAMQFSGCCTASNSQTWQSADGVADNTHAAMVTGTHRTRHGSTCSTAAEAHWNFSASTMFADAMILTMTAEDSSCVNSTKDGAGTIVTHTFGKTGNTRASGAGVFMSGCAIAETLAAGYSSAA
jgi:hypothetical protein